MLASFNKFEFHNFHNIYSFTSFRACQNGYLEQVNCLINAGAKCTAHKSTKCTPLYAGEVLGSFLFFPLGRTKGNYLKQKKIDNYGVSNTKC